MARAVDRVRRAAVEKSVSEDYLISPEDRAEMKKFLQDIMRHPQMGSKGCPAHRDGTRAVQTLVMMEKANLERLRLYTELGIGFADDDASMSPGKALFVHKAMLEAEEIYDRDNPDEASSEATEDSDHDR